MKTRIHLIRLFKAMVLLWYVPLCSQTITSQAELKYHLSRAVTLSDLSPMQNVPDEYDSAIQLLADIDAKFVGRVESRWGTPIVQPWFINSISAVINDINAAYDLNSQSRPLVQACLFEVIIKDAVEANFATPELFNLFYGPGIVTESRAFDWDLMIYDNDHRINQWTPSSTTRVPDLSKPETRAYFYYLSTIYINAGFTSIHFGQIGLMDDNDPGHVLLWDLLSKIRNYAIDSANSFVLIDAHSPVGNEIDFDPYYSVAVRDFTWNIINAYPQYFTSPLDLIDSEGRDMNHYFEIVHGQSLNGLPLLFDFLSMPCRPKETTNDHGDCRVIFDSNFSDALYNKSPGGISPILGTYTESPYLAEVDNYQVTPCVGCLAETDSSLIWGCDEITWFLNQRESYQAEFIKYAYCKIQEFDSHGFFQIPAYRGCLSGSGDFDCSAWNASALKEAIIEAWEGSDGSYLWDYHNSWSPANAGGDIVVEVPGTNSNLFYVGNDNDIHMLSDMGTWWSGFDFDILGFPHNVALNSELRFHSPGNLFYRGTDQRIHYFEHLGSWTYHNTWGPQYVKGSFDLINEVSRKVFYHGTDDQIHMLSDLSTCWSDFTFTNAEKVKNSIRFDSENTLFYVGINNKVNVLDWVTVAVGLLIQLAWQMLKIILL